MVEDIILPGRRRLAISERPLVMGILNVTDDSFYDGGRYSGFEAALKHAEKMAEEGADIIDIGGESTRPGSEPIEAEREIERVVPVIEAIRKRHDIPISVDTYKAEVARCALKAGADIINDISGLRFDSGMVEAALETEAPVVVMHIQGMPRDMQKNPRYENVVEEVKAYFAERFSTLTKAGINASRIIFDPGIGFGKNLEHNLALLSRLDELAVSGRPLLVGASRKSFIGAVTGKKVDDRLAGTVAVTVAAVLLGAAIIRVHDVAPNLEAVRVALALRKNRALTGGLVIA